MSKPNNPPAFPHAAYETNKPLTATSWHDGMTLRDYFACAAMQSLLAQKRRAKFAETMMPTVRAAYDIADAMLEERAKQ